MGKLAADRRRLKGVPQGVEGLRERYEVKRESLRGSGGAQHTVRCEKEETSQPGDWGLD